MQMGNESASSEAEKLKLFSNIPGSATTRPLIGAEIQIGYIAAL
jgi:hypothetical protein